MVQDSITSDPARGDYALSSPAVCSRLRKRLRHQPRMAYSNSTYNTAQQPGAWQVPDSGQSLESLYQEPSIGNEVANSLYPATEASSSIPQPNNQVCVTAYIHLLIMGYARVRALVCILRMCLMSNHILLGECRSRCTIASTDTDPLYSRTRCTQIITTY